MSSYFGNVVALNGMSSVTVVTQSLLSPTVLHKPTNPVSVADLDMAAPSWKRQHEDGSPSSESSDAFLATLACRMIPVLATGSLLRQSLVLSLFFVSSGFRFPSARLSPREDLRTPCWQRKAPRCQDEICL